MGDIVGQIKDERGGFVKLLSKIPGFKGYMEKETRRDADKLVRDAIASRFSAQLDRLSEVQSDLIPSGGFEFLDDVEQAAVKLRTFIDRVKTARLLECLKRYQRRVHQQTNEPMEPLHDEFSHGADNLRYIGQAVELMGHETKEDFEMPPPPDWRT